MKKIYFSKTGFLFMLCILSGMLSFGQATYYWVGGTSGEIGAATSWNTNLNGSGTERPAINPLDILIFDGSNIGGAAASTGTVTPDITGSFSVSQLRIINAAQVVFQRNAGGTTSLTVIGDSGPDDDFILDAASSLTITTLGGSGFNILIGDPGASEATAAIRGTLSILDNGSGTARLTAITPASVQFKAGSVLNSNLTQSSAYPFGSGSTNPAAAVLGVVFESGSTCKFMGGNSINANTSGFFPVKWEKGSTLEMNAPQPSGLFGNRYLSNIRVMPGVIITLTDNPYGIDTITISEGASFAYRTSSVFPVKGDIINNGTFGANTGFTSANLVLIGKVPQNITGSGTFNNLGTLSVGNDASVSLDANIMLSGTSTSTITGKLNTQTFTVSGTGNFQFRTANSATSNVTLTEGSNTVTFNGSAAYSAGNVAIGTRVTGDGIAPDTYIISTSSGSQSFNMSNPATNNFPGFTASITIENTPATLETANPGGADGSILSTGTRTFSTNTNYIFNAPTLTPFSASTSNNAGNVTFNAAATLNKTNQGMNGVLTLGAGVLTIPATDTLEINGGMAIAGAPFSASKYIHTQVSGSNAGVLKINDINPGSMLFPVGDATTYLPAMLTPSTVSNHSVSVFTGITEEGTPGGTAFSVAKKASVVDAVWIISRQSGTGDCSMTLGWQTPLEGIAFTSYADNEIGIARHDGTSWSITSGTGDNTLNTSTSAFSSFSSFGVGRLGIVLPVIFKSTTAIAKGAGTEISWDVANEESTLRFEIERSADPLNFSKAGTVLAANKGIYSFLDQSPMDFVTYYRVKNIDQKGDATYSKIVSVRNNSNTEISFYPNPVSNEVTFSGLKQGALVRVVNANGQVIKQQIAATSIIRMNVSSFSSGIYYAEVVTPEGDRQTKKFIKQ